MYHLALLFFLDLANFGLTRFFGFATFLLLLKFINYIAYDYIVGETINQFILIFLKNK
jgi:hypothetical protein